MFRFLFFNLLVTRMCFLSLNIFFAFDPNITYKILYNKLNINKEMKQIVLVNKKKL